MVSNGIATTTLNNQTAIPTTEFKTSTSLVFFGLRSTGTWDSIQTIVNLTIGFFGFLFNVSALTVIIAHKPLWKQFSNRYVSAQCTVDCLVGFFLFFLTLFDNANVTFRPNYFWDELACRFWFSSTFLWTSLLSSTYVKLALTFERYLAVVHPLIHRNKFSTSKWMPGFTIGVAILIGPMYNLTYQSVTATIVVTGQCFRLYKWSSDEAKLYIGLLTLVIQYFCPLAIFIVLYSKIAWTLHQKGKINVAVASGERTNIEENNESNGGEKITSVEYSGVSYNETQQNHQQQQQNQEPHNNQQKRKQRKPTTTMHKARDSVMKTSIWITLNFIVCWTCNQFYFLLRSFNSTLFSIDNIVYKISVALIYVNCVINPIIYILKYEDFQRAIQVLFLDKLRRRFPNLRLLSRLPKK